jgi:hypothetical protein
MSNIILQSSLLKFGFFLAAMEAALFYLKRLDRRNGTDWGKEIAPLLEKDALAAGIYYGARIFAITLACAILFS